MFVSDESILRDYFKTNTSQRDVCFTSGPLIRHVAAINKARREGIEGSFPEHIITFDEMRKINTEIESINQEWRAMKMIVFGSERIGKTTFVTALKESTIVSTVGIDCKKMKISRGQVTVMDFAGQMEYTVTHQFFLSNEVCNDIQF